MKEDREKLTPAERFEWYKKQMPAAEKYIYMNSGGCGPMPTSVLKSMEDVFERMVQEGQVNVNIHGWLKALLEDVRKSVAYPCRAGGNLFCPLYSRGVKYHCADV